MTAKDAMTGLVLETSAACQLNCPLCFLRSYEERPEPLLMPVEVAQAVAPFLSGLDSIDLTGWGEPLLNPHLFEIMALVRENFSGRLTITTNGMLLDRPAMEKLIEYSLDTVCISIDAANERSYRAVRPGGNFIHLRRVMDDFISLRDSMQKDRPQVFATFLLRKDALSELDDFVGMVSGHGLAGVVFQQLTGVFSEEGLARVTHREYYYNRFECKLLDEAIEQAREAAPAGFVIAGPEEVCSRRVGGCGGFDVSRAFVTSAGDVSVCCAMAYPCTLLRRDRKPEKTRAVTFGNVLERALPEIWNDPAYAAIRAGIRAGEAVDACGDCIALYMKPGGAWTAPGD